MKKIFVSAAAILIAATSFAQKTGTKSPNELSIGVDGGLPMSDLKNSNKFGFGGTLKFAHNFDESFALTLTSGYLSFPGKNVYGFDVPAIGIVPIKLGGRYSFPGGVYAEPQFGASIINQEVGTGFTYAFNLGYNMTPGIDVSARYENTKKEDFNFSFVGFRLAYSFGFGK